MRRAIHLLGLISLLAAPAAWGAGFAVSEQSPVAGGTGGAGVARAGDPGAAWYCPAALADGGGLRLGAGILLAFPQITAAAQNGNWDARTSGTPSTPPHVYLSYARGPWAAGLAFNVPFGSTVSWPERWAGRFEIVSSKLMVFRLAPFVAWRFGRVALAAGVHVDLARLQVQRRLDFVDQEGQVKLDLSDVGVGGHAALYVDLLPGTLALAASYKSRTVLALEGSAQFDAPAAFEAQAHDQRVSAGYTLPDLITVGAHFAPHKRVAVVLDVGVAVWSVYQRLELDFEHDATSDVRQETRWETRVLVRGGAEVKALPWLTARAGMFFDPTPIPEDTLAPNSPDSDRLGFSVGLGLELPVGLAVDLFYTHVLMLGQPSSNPENLHADYAGNLHLLGVGLRWSSRGLL